jgi:hypothetical protein
LPNNLLSFPLSAHPDLHPEIVPHSKLDFCHFVFLGAEISPIQVAASSFISDCNGAWRVKISKTTLQEKSLSVLRKKNWPSGMCTDLTVFNKLA